MDLSQHPALGASLLPLAVCTALTALTPPPAQAETAPLLLLARDWTAGQSPQGFLVSEKFDGVRALWDGRQLRFRGGGAVAAPAWFLARLPRQSLDGELWLGHGRFDEVSALLRRGDPDDPGWHAVQYRVFELPDAPGGFAQRAGQIEALVAAAAWPQLVAVSQEPVVDATALQRLLAAVVAAGGEGLVLHRADAPYQTGRTEALFKFKPVQDAEAVVIGHEEGHGKYVGMVGALRVRNEAGQVFLLGSGLKDAQRRQPPPLGTRVTYSWRGLTASGLPRFATLLRVRDPGF
ncbi:DNA ligase [Ideonella oryzae]|uniref:DNA ligase n=1 Tax=Ideonella oryzae TaxID=2937441 RepID=A0ABT1BJE6_9BURK|nr:DNA ligase [Ideonella oryzae]MCO5976238.1 DNA ligase [Ideonella oryzae]